MADNSQYTGTMFGGRGPMQVTDTSGDGSTDTPAFPAPQPTTPATPPPSPLAGLSSSLAGPQQSIDNNPAVQAAHKTLLGKVTGDLFRGIAGGHYETAIDPTTGKTTETFVKAQPGEWARNTVNAALLGMKGIGPKNGQVTGLQGFLAGLSGGAQAREELSDKQRATAELKAQQDYANQLKAQEAQRQQKELNLRGQLNKAQVAHENIETAVQSQILHEHLANEEGAASRMLIDASKDTLQDYVDAGEKPFKEGLDQGDLQKLMASDAGISAKYKAIPTGQKVVQGTDGKNHVETTYSLYAPLTKVPDTLISKMAGLGMDKTAPAMFRELQQASKNGTDVDYRKIAVAQKEISKQFDYQKGLDDHRLKMAEIAKDQQEGGAAWIRANKDRYEFGKEMHYDNGQQVYNSNFNPQTGALDLSKLPRTPEEFIANWQAEHKDPKTGKPSTARPSQVQIEAGLKKAAQDRADLNGYFDGLNQYYGNELLKYEKKDPNTGVYSITDPAGVGIANLQNNLKKGVAALHGITPPGVPPPSSGIPTLSSLAMKAIQGLPPETVNTVSSILKDVHQAGRDVSASDGKQAVLELLNKDPRYKNLSTQQLEEIVDVTGKYFDSANTILQDNQKKAEEDQRNREDILKGGAMEKARQGMAAIPQPII